MASDEEVKSSIFDYLEWNVENEIRLFEAMIGHKPVGINKHFHMACISEKFENLMGKPVSSDLIWKHLETMFDLTALDKKESLPFPNEQEEFSLPETEFSELISEKLASVSESSAETKENIKEAKALVKTTKDLTPAKETVTKKDKKLEPEETVSNNEVEKKESVESENDSKKGRVSKEEKLEKKRRGPRSTKEKKLEDENLHAPPTLSKKEEESSSVSSGSKKEKQSVGKRSLRSRVDDVVSSKSLTPPPMKRGRRI